MIQRRDYRIAMFSTTATDLTLGATTTGDASKFHGPPHR
jgi:hypothetical protein